MVPPLSANQTLERARALLESGRGAALPELLELVETLSLNVCEVTISELAELIEKDPAVLAKVLSVANKLVHNPGIAPIGTLSQAIHQIGYNRIRSIAVSMMLLDHAGAANAPEQREAAALALSAGLIAQGAAEFAGTHDPEFVFACATLRHFGRVLMATISPDHARRAIELARAEPAVDGFRRMFGLSVYDLGRRVLSAARLPEDVLRTLRDCEPETLTGSATTYETRLLALADLGSRIAFLALESQDDAAGFGANLTRLSRRFQRLVPCAEDVARPALLRADERLRSFSRCSGTNGLPTASLARLRRHAASLAPDSDSETAGPNDASRPHSHDPVANTVGAGEPSNPEIREKPAEVAESIAVSAEPLEESPIDSPTAALTTLQELLGAQECWVFRRNAGGTALVLEIGVGATWQSVQARAILRDDSRDVFGVCLSRGEVVLLHDASDATRRGYLPAWWHEGGAKPQAIALFPIGSGSAQTLVLAGWREAHRITLTQARIAAVHRLVEMLPAPTRTAA